MLKVKKFQNPEELAEFVNASMTLSEEEVLQKLMGSPYQKKEMPKQITYTIQQIIFDARREEFVLFYYIIE